ncbi:MAG: response regulator [Burkholderiales bacterium]|nr:MAG: response regulator [Burkholderiales bacterium]
MPDQHDFGHFSVRLQQRQVLINGEPAALGSRAFEVLRVLLERRERVVPKDELMQLAWPGVVVEENNLTVQMTALRKLLGASTITTVPGRGYQFTPAVADSRSTHAEADTDTAPPLARPHLATRGRLLVAEDNRVNRLLLVRSLELLGHQVVAVDDGRKALEALRAQRFDLLLLDLGMPQMDGFEVLEAMARDPELRDVSVVVTSSVEAVDRIARCIELGADDYLHKPVDPVLLRARVASSLEKARLREQQRELVQRLTVAAAGHTRATDMPASQAERAEATVLAVKLRHAANANQLLSAADLVGWLDECHTLWRDAVANHGGVVFGDCGGTLLAIFGLASGSSTAPTKAQARLSATRAALDMAEMQDLFNAERLATGKAVAALASGIASGTLTAGSARSGLQSSGVCVGEPVDAALALAWQATVAPTDTEGGHQLWIDAATQSALIGRVATEKLTPTKFSSMNLHRAAVFAIKLGFEN